MLMIRSAQLELLNHQHVDGMVEMVFRHIADRHPERIAGLAETDARREVAATIERARGYGIVTTAGIGTFAALCFVVSPQFDEHPKVRAILEGTVNGLDALTPDARIEALGALLSDSDWRDAQDLGRVVRPQERGSRG